MWSFRNLALRLQRMLQRKLPTTAPAAPAAHASAIAAAAVSSASVATSPIPTADSTPAIAASTVSAPSVPAAESTASSHSTATAAASVSSSALATSANAPATVTASQATPAFAAPTVAATLAATALAATAVASATDAPAPVATTPAAITTSRRVLQPLPAPHVPRLRGRRAVRLRQSRTRVRLCGLLLRRVATAAGAACTSTAAVPANLFILPERGTGSDAPRIIRCLAGACPSDFGCGSSGAMVPARALAEATKNAHDVSYTVGFNALFYTVQCHGALFRARA